MGLVGFVDFLRHLLCICQKVSVTNNIYMDPQTHKTNETHRKNPEDISFDSMWGVNGEKINTFKIFSRQ